MPDAGIAKHVGNKVHIVKLAENFRSRPANGRTSG